MSQASSKNKLSVGTLRKTPKKTKPRSPNLIGSLHLQRHTFEAFEKQYQMTDCKEIVCNIAAWSYSDESGPFLTVEISPPYKRTKPPQPDILDAIFNNDGEQN